VETSVMTACSTSVNSIAAIWPGQSVPCVPMTIDPPTRPVGMPVSTRSTALALVRNNSRLSNETSIETDFTVFRFIVPPKRLGNKFPTLGKLVQLFVIILLILYGKGCSTGIYGKKRAWFEAGNMEEQEPPTGTKPMEGDEIGQAGTSYSLLG
jgi:hypothetical protein